MEATILVLLSILTLIPYYNVHGLISKKGLLLFAWGLFLIILRFVFLYEIPTKIFNAETFLTSSVYSLLITSIIILIIYSIYKKPFIFSRYALKLFSGYFLLAVLQQTFFQSVFLDSLLVLFTGQILIPIIISSVFYASFHIRPKFRKFIPLLFILNIFYSLIYIYFGNIFPLALSHSIIGTFYLISSSENDEIFERLLKK